MRSWCFDSVATEVDGVVTYDREYGSAEFREVIRKLVGNGVYANPANNMQVTAAGGMGVTVQPGYCWINGALGIVDEAETLTLDVSANGRTDAIVARFDLSLDARDIHLHVIKGSEGSYDPPELTRNESVYDIKLAQVRISANSSNITMAAITDTRFDSSACGIVTGIINQIDATNLFAQYGATFDDFMSELENTLSEDAAGNLLVLLNTHKSDRTNPHGVTSEQVGLGNVLNEKQYCASNPVITISDSYEVDANSTTTLEHSEDFGKPQAFFVTVVDLAGTLKDSFFVPLDKGISADVYFEYYSNQRGRRFFKIINRNQEKRIVYYMGIV